MTARLSPSADPRTILVDLGPLGGAHGQRGIGRYVRGLRACHEALPADLRDRIWASAPGPVVTELDGDRLVGNRLHQLPVGVPPRILGLFAMRGALAASRARVVHHTDPQRPWWRAGLDMVVTVYDLIPLHEPAMLRSWRADFRATFSWYLDQIRAARRVIAISDTTAADLSERLSIDRGRIDIVYPVVASESPSSRTPAPEPLFIALGALDPHKQPELAIRALAAYNRATGAGSLDFIGPSSAERVRELSELATRLRVGERVAFRGRIPDTELEGLFASATALLLTSRVEGFGLPAVEAAIRGVPVVATDTPAAREVVGGIAAIVPPDAEAIAAAMTRPLPIVESARAELAARFSLPAAAASLRRSYELALG